jgi:uncharacterized protein (TIGR04141 family)
LLVPLNAFLLRSKATPVTSLTDKQEYSIITLMWDGEAWLPVGEDERGLLEAAVSGDVLMVLLARPSGMPNWQRFIQREVALLPFPAASTSFGVVVFCAVKDASTEVLRWVAWCFGSGSRALKRSAQDPRFGLSIALNLIADANNPAKGSVSDPRRGRGPQFRELRYRTTAPYFQQTGHRAARDIPVEGFRIDRLSDLVAGVGGRSDTDLATSIFGSRSIRFRKDVESIAALAALSDEIIKISASQSYRKNFAWVDNIQPVEDDATVDRLTATLLADLLAEPIPPNIDAILPDDLVDPDDERSIGFILYPGERQAAASRTNLTVNMVAQLLRRSGDPLLALDSNIRFLDDAHRELGSVRLLECICADLQIEGEVYIAYEGDYYKVARSFIEQIDEQLGLLPLSTLTFPAYPGKTEPQYLDRIRSDHSDDFIVLDRQLLRVEGESGVEACDLVSASGALIHVKRKGKSSTLSHLFLQVTNSCELLRRSGEANRQLSELVAANAATPDLAEKVRAIHDSRIRGLGLEVVFAFMGDWRGRDITSLPLFSRISLVQEARRVANLGFDPTIALIGAQGAG